jgi:uncharacterized OsmC-like protein
MPWVSLQCAAEGTLARLDGVTKFTAFAIHATLQVPPEADAEKAKRLFEKAETSCLITNSMTAATHLTAIVESAG